MKQSKKQPEPAPLTLRLYRALRAIADLTKKSRGVPPSYPELAHELGVSLRAAHRAVKQLEQGRWVKTEVKKWRAIHVIQPVPRAPKGWMKER